MDYIVKGIITFASEEQGKKPPVFKEIADGKDYVIYISSNTSHI